MCGEGDAHAEEGAKSLAFWEVNKYCLIQEKKKSHMACYFATWRCMSKLQPKQVGKLFVQKVK